MSNERPLFQTPVSNAPASTMQNKMLYPCRSMQITGNETVYSRPLYRAEIMQQSLSDKILYPCASMQITGNETVYTRPLYRAEVAQQSPLD